MVKATLNSIPGRDKISEKIADDPENVKHVQDELKTVEEKMTEKVMAVVGDIKLQTF